MSLARQPARFIVLDTGQSIPLNAPEMVVGRTDARYGIYPDITLEHKTLGRRHALLRSQNGNYTIEDLNSLNRSWLNDVILTPKQEYPLKDGDILQFGSVKVRFEDKQRET